MMLRKATARFLYLPESMRRPMAARMAHLPICIFKTRKLGARDQQSSIVQGVDRSIVGDLQFLCFERHSRGLGLLTASVYS